MENVEKNDQDSPEQQQQENKNKVAKAFDQNIEKIQAIIGKAPSKKKGRRIPADKFAAIVEELYAEDDKSSQEEAKKELRGLLDKYTDVWTQIGVKEKELEDLKTNKMKEFNEASKKFLDKIDGLPGLMASKAAALKQMVTGGGSEEQK